MSLSTHVSSDPCCWVSVAHAARACVPHPRCVELLLLLSLPLLWLNREKTERAAAQVKVDASVGFAADKEAALRTVDELRRQSKHQEDSFDALVRERAGQIDCRGGDL